MERNDRNWKNKGKGKKYGGAKDFGHSIAKDQELTGMLITCSGTNEKVAVQDIYKILNRFAEEVVPGFEEFNEANLAKRKPEGEGEQKAHVKPQRPFQQMRMKAKGMIFIIMNKSISEKISAEALARHVLDSIEKEKVLLTRFCSRLYPIQFAVDASLENFEKYMAPMVLQHLPENAELQRTTWCLRFKCRSNSKFKRDDFFSILLKLIPPCYHFIQYKADVEVFVDITHHTMCLAVLKPYSEHKYYSFQKMIEQSAPKQKNAAGEEESAEDPKSIEEAGAKVDDDASLKSDIDIF